MWYLPSMAGMTKAVSPCASTRCLRLARPRGSALRLGPLATVLLHRVRMQGNKRSEPGKPHAPAARKMRRYIRSMFLGGFARSGADMDVALPSFAYHELAIVQHAYPWEGFGFSADRAGGAGCRPVLGDFASSQVSANVSRFLTCSAKSRQRRVTPPMIVLDWR